MSTPATTVSQLVYQTQSQFVASMTSVFGGSLNITPNLIPGQDPELAVFEATAAQDVYLEFLLQVIWAAARASTAQSSDLDTFVNDFGLTRLPATYAQGPVTLSALSAPVTAVPVAAGTIVQTPGGAIQYQLVADTTQAAWNPTLNAYVLQAGQTSITATAQATVAGSVDNVQPGQLTQFGTAVAGVTTVTNTIAITNGLDQETDPALRARFVSYLASLSKATLQACLFAINSVQQGLDTLPLENTNVNLVTQYGANLFIVDNGTGSPPSSLLTNVLNALNAVRAFGIQMAVKGPTTTQVSVALTAVTVQNPTETSATIQSNVQNAILNYINSFQLSDGSQYLYLNSIIDVAINSDPNIVTIVLGSLTLNGVATDLLIGTGGLPQATLENISVTLQTL